MGEINKKYVILSDLSNVTDVPNVTLVAVVLYNFNNMIVKHIFKCVTLI